MQTCHGMPCLPTDSFSENGPVQASVLTRPTLFIHPSSLVNSTMTKTLKTEDKRIEDDAHLMNNMCREVYIFLCVCTALFQQGVPAGCRHQASAICGGTAHCPCRPCWCSSVCSTPMSSNGALRLYLHVLVVEWGHICGFKGHFAWPVSTKGVPKPRGPSGEEVRTPEF